MTHHGTLLPAYGRDYKSKKDVESDWLAGKDFLIANVMSPYDGKPTSIRDYQKGDSVNIRYQQARKVAVLTVK